ncbi:MAG: outer membrane protein assembly factor BamD [Treponema sp.]|jgi:hypothetical protein|nr:outer membrane protein assembly factor BamD [Treponema sp.]
MIQRHIGLGVILCLLGKGLPLVRADGNPAVPGISPRAAGEYAEVFVPPAHPGALPRQAGGGEPDPQGALAQQQPLSPGQEEAAAQEGINYSRIVQLREGQVLEIPFRESGWVYLGEMKSQRGLEYSSRRPDPEGQSFVFRAEKAGVYALKFYKQDFIRDYIINDYVQVAVTAAPGQTKSASQEEPRVIAGPRWPLLPGGEDTGSEAASAGPAAPPPSQGARGPSADAPEPSWEPTQRAASGLPPEPPPVPEAAPAPAASAQNLEERLQAVRAEYEAGRIIPGLELLGQFKEQYPLGSDEAWWFYGRLLEAVSPSRDIRSALDYYRRLIKEYPQSPRYMDAKRRINYLERFYFMMR